jgi:hypothetical protein
MTASLGIRVIRSSLADWRSMKKECRHARHRIKGRRNRRIYRETGRGANYRKLSALRSVATAAERTVAVSPSPKPHVMREKNPAYVALTSNLESSPPRDRLDFSMEGE